MLYFAFLIKRISRLKHEMQSGTFIMVNSTLVESKNVESKNVESKNVESKNVESSKCRKKFIKIK